MLTRCEDIYKQTDRLIERMQGIYTAHALPPPVGQHELTSAILNGAAYYRDPRLRSIYTAILLPEKSLMEATCLCNNITRIAHDLREKAINKTKYLCLKCMVAVADEDRAITCDLCEGWQHISCDNIVSEKLYDEILNGRADLEWLCKKCRMRRQRERKKLNHM